MLKNSPSEVTRTIAERTVVAKVIILFGKIPILIYFLKDWDQYDSMSQEAVVNGSSVVEIGLLYDYELEWGRWHRSQDRKGGDHPFASFMLNKKWTMEEKFNNHILRFQQVKCSQFYLFQ